MLQRYHPLVKAMSFVGQSTKSASRGLAQKEQIRVRTTSLWYRLYFIKQNLFQVVKEFKVGNYNTLISTCVGEEGMSKVKMNFLLDIE